MNADSIGEEEANTDGIDREEANADCVGGKEANVEGAGKRVQVLVVAKCRDLSGGHVGLREHLGGRCA